MFSKTFYSSLQMKRSNRVCLNENNCTTILLVCNIVITLRPN